MKNLWRWVGLLAVVLLGWRVIVVGLAQHYAERLAHGDDGAVEALRAWAPHHPRALLAEATTHLPNDPRVAEARLAEAYRRDPTDSRPLRALAWLAYAAGDFERADGLMAEAVRIMPASPSTLTEAARYWVSRGELEKAVAFWSRTLEADARQADELFPTLMAIVEDPQSRPAIRPIAQAPPSWWERFFAEVAQRALEVETVRSLYGLRRGAQDAPLTDKERRAYIQRLQREGLITEAYLTWVNGLTEAERQHLGLLYNGSFELEPSQRAFGWHVRRSRQLAIRLAATYGIKGNQALYLRFGQWERRFRHLYQPLFLDPGHYRLSGQVRLEGLDTAGGLRWQVSCRLPAREVLAESERFLGTSDWRAFSVDFTVSADCSYQEVRLISSGRRAFEHKLDGVAWFDALRIRKIEELSATARVDELKSGEEAELDAESTSPTTEAEEPVSLPGDRRETKGGGALPASPPL